MSRSFNRIDYSIRPAKYAERRMLRDVFRRLSAFEPCENYAYVGFGSVWFSDFSLFHRSLGVQQMLSIESSKAAEQRVRDNAPFKISLAFDRSTKVLPTMSWEGRKFVWLDYDEALTPDMLRDLRTCVMNVRSGSVISISVRCSAAKEADQAAPEDDDEAVNALPIIERFREKFANWHVPEEVGEDDLYGWPYADLINTMIETEIEVALAVRNGPRAGPDFCSKKICTINYQDGAMMTTYVALIFSEDERDKSDACNFDTLSFVESPTTPVHINVPKLTPREFRLLEGQLPNAPQEALALGSIPLKEAAAFRQFYRYFPNFVVTEN